MRAYDVIRAASLLSKKKELLKNKAAITDRNASDPVVIVKFARTHPVGDEEFVAARLEGNAWIHLLIEGIDGMIGQIEKELKDVGVEE